jgi:hypothetical protein
VVPPEGVTLADPLLPPLQDTLVKVEAEAVRVVGWVTVVLEIAVQPCESVTVTEYVPAVRPVAVAVVCRGEVLQL